MGRYSYSKFRLALFLVLLGAGLFIGSSGYAQSTNGNGTQAKQQKEGLASLILRNMDPVFGIIALCSVAGVTLIIQGFIQNRRSVMLPESTIGQIREMIQNRQFKELMDFTEADPSFVSRALNPALKRAPSFSSMKEAMETAIGEQTAEQFRKIEYLNIIGNLGPLLGLLGTVLGMIDAFGEMSAAGGNASPAQLSYGISKALAHTFLGLMLAVPCLAAFGILRTLVDRLTIRGALIAEELLLMIKPSETQPPAPSRMAATAPTPAAATPARPIPTAPKAAIPLSSSPAVDA